MPDLVEAPVGEMNWLERAIERGVDAPTLEKLIDLKQRMEDRIARQAFALAMNHCQKEMPRLVKDTKGQNNQYVQLETLKDRCSPIWLKHGFSISWSQSDSPSPDLTRVVATLYHTDGHFERYQGDYPIDGRGAKGGGVMTPLQGTVSAHTYAQRDMIRLMFDLTIAGKDLDGAATNGRIDAATIKLINTLWDECCSLDPAMNWEAVLPWLKVESLEDLDDRGAEKLIRELTRKRAEPVNRKKGGAK